MMDEAEAVRYFIISFILWGSVYDTVKEMNGACLKIRVFFLISLEDNDDFLGKDMTW